MKSCRMYLVLFGLSGLLLTGCSVPAGPGADRLPASGEINKEALPQAPAAAEPKQRMEEEVSPEPEAVTQKPAAAEPEVATKEEPESEPEAVVAPSNARLGINLQSLNDWNSGLPFYDVFRMSRSWISQKNGQPWGKGPALNLDERGWVKSLDPDCYAETLVCTLPEGEHYPSGTYTLLYEGEGEITADTAAKVAFSEPGRMLLDVDSQLGGIRLQIRSTNPENYIRNIRLLMPGFKDYDYSKPPWNPGFLARWKGFACLRFMDWMETNNAWLENWSDRPLPINATVSLSKERHHGLSMEWMCDLVNRLDIDGWFCIPNTATDDCVREMLTFLRDHVEPERKIYIEYSNETWNSMFQQYRDAAQKGMELGFSTREWEAAWAYTGLRSRQIFGIAEEVFGDELSRVIRIVPSQASNAYVTKQVLKAEGLTEHMDAIAIAPYITMNVKNDEAEAVAAMTVDEIMDKVENECLPNSIDWIRQHAELARQHNVKLVAYEGGQHLVGIGEAVHNDQLTEILMKANRTERMGQVYTKYFDAWEEAGGDLFCVWVSISSWSKWGSWGLAEYADDDPNSIPKYKTTLDWARERGQDVIQP